MSTVIATSVLPDSTANDTLTFGATGDSVVISGDSLNLNTLQDVGGNTIFVSDGSGLITSTGLPGAMKFISSQTASTAASLSFTTGIDSTYDVYKFIFVDINPSTDAYLTINFSSDGGSNYNMTKTTTFFEAYHYESGSSGLTYQTSWDLDESTAAQPLSQHTGGTDTDNCVAGELHLFAPSSTTFVKHFYSTSNNLASAAISQNTFVAGYVNSTSAINAVQFKLNTGTFDGTIALYGISKS